MERKSYVIPVILLLLVPLVSAFNYMGETCSEDPADYETFNDTGFFFTGSINDYVNMETTVSTGQYTLLFLNWKHVSDTSYPFASLRDSTTTSFLRTNWKNDDFSAYDNTFLTKVADAPDGPYYNWSVSFDFESDQFNATLNDVIEASNWGIYDHTKNFSRVYFKALFGGLVEASDFYVFEGSSCPTAGAADTCTYTSGNWNVDCSDNCDIVSDVNVDGDIILNGAGSFRIASTIKANSFAFPSNICGLKIDGGTLAIK